jgi:hypothetical protein
MVMPGNVALGEADILAVEKAYFRAPGLKNRE